MAWQPYFNGALYDLETTFKCHSVWAGNHFKMGHSMTWQPYLNGTVQLGNYI